MSAKVTGIDKVLDGITKTVARFRHAFEAACFTNASDIATVAVDNAPKKTGQLRGSVFVTRTMPVEIGFGARHAAIAHETGPRKKFLQRAASEGAGRARARVALLTADYARSGTTLASVSARHPERPSASWPTSSTRRRPGAPARRRLP